MKSRKLFLMQFGNTSQLRVLDFLIDNQFFDYPMTEIARESNVSYNSIVKFFDDLVKTGVVVKTRRIGKSDYYQLNLDNPFISNLIRLDWILTKKNALGEIEEKIILKKKV